MGTMFNAVEQANASLAKIVKNPETRYSPNRYNDMEIGRVYSPNSYIFFRLSSVDFCWFITNIMGPFG